MKFKVVTLLLLLPLMLSHKAIALSTIKKPGLVIHLSGEGLAYSVEVKSANRHFIQDSKTNKWTYSRLEKNQQISIQSQANKIYFFYPKQFIDVVWKPSK